MELDDSQFRSLDKPREHCGVFGVFAPGEDVARITFFGLFSLQHRGQESAGIATADGEKMFLRKGMGLVSQIFDEQILSDLGGFAAIGHNRYSTSGSSRPENAAPFLEESGKKFALAFNGNLINSLELKKEMESQGINFYSTTDTEIIAKTISLTPGRNLTEKIKKAMTRLKGAYSMVILTKDSLYAARDPLGVRPFCLGRLDGGYVVSSESCALNTVGAKFLREIEPGEVLKVNKNGVSREKLQNKKNGFCIFEYIYFSRPDSSSNGKSIYAVREKLGKILAKEYPVKADLVIGVPDSAIPAAIGYSIESGIPYREGLIKNRYIGRTFINPDQRLREWGVKLKLHALPEVLKGKRVVLVDDSIVRGNTTGKIVKIVKDAGAKEVHVIITAPPMTHPCFLGVDTATKKELIAHRLSVPEIRDFIGADSLGYNSLEGLVRATGLPKEKFCLACFNGKYPLKLGEKQGKFVLEKAVRK